MDRNTLSLRLQAIEDELPKLTNTLFAMKITNTDQYPTNYEQLGIEACVRAEKIACSLRSLIYAANLVPAPVLMSRISDAQGITVTEDHHGLTILLPGLLPRQDRRKNCSFLTEPLRFALEGYIHDHPCKAYGSCVICFQHVFDRALSKRRVRDYDNYECKQILDVISSSLLTDDSGILCDVYHTTAFGDADATLVTLLSCEHFPDWLLEQKNDL